jgi:hypothetical protein
MTNTPTTPANTMFHNGERSLAQDMTRDANRTPAHTSPAASSAVKTDQPPSASRSSFSAAAPAG